MKCNLKGQAQKRLLEKNYKLYAEITRKETARIIQQIQNEWLICLLLALRDCGYGQKRISSILEALDTRKEEFWRKATSTDTKEKQISNAQYVTAQALAELNDGGFDWRTVFEQIVIDDVDCGKLADRICRKKRKNAD